MSENLEKVTTYKGIIERIDWNEGRAYLSLFNDKKEEANIQLN